MKNIRAMAMPSELHTQILSYRGCNKEGPLIRYFNRLIRAYIYVRGTKPLPEARLSG